MQKYPLCQVYKYPALSFRSLLLFSFFLSDFLFRRSVFHALPEPSALSLAVAVASQQQSWVLCMGPSEGDAPQGPPHPGSSPVASPPNFLQVISLGNQRESRREEDGRRTGLAVFHLVDRRMPLLQGRASLLGWATCPKSKDRGAVVQKGIRLPSPSSPTFSARTAGIFRPWLGFKVATGAEESPRAEPRLARDAVGTHAPATRTSRRRVWSQAAAAPSRLPHNLA